MESKLAITANNPKTPLEDMIAKLHANLMARGITGRKARQVIQAELRKASRKAIKAKALEDRKAKP